MPDAVNTEFILDMQRKLFRWSDTDADKVFMDLSNLVFDRRTLEYAWRRLRANAGSRTPGTDGVTRRSVERHEGGVARFLGDIQHELKAGTYKPEPVRQRLIPKAGKPGKFRPLGIPTLRDRLVQMALKLILEPIFEADFYPTSYGFRRGRNTHDAIAMIQAQLNPGPHGDSRVAFVIEGDIKGCFDNIDHHLLMRSVRRRIGDRKILNLVRAFIKAGIMVEGSVRHPVAGTPQGGIITPPTILQNATFACTPRIGGWREWVDTKHDIDVVAVDLDPLDEHADQLALHVPIDLGHSVVNPSGEVLKPSDDERQRRPQGRLVAHGLELRLPALDALPQAGDARLELRPLDQVFGIAVDQAAHAPAQLGELHLSRGEVRTISAAPLCAGEAPLILRRDPGRVAQQALDLAPDRLVQPVGADLGVRAHALAAEAVGVAAAAPVVSVVASLAFRGAQADSLAVVGVSAPGTHQQPLQEVAHAASALPAAAPVLGELLANGVEQRRFHQPRHRHADPLGRGHVVEPVGATRLLAAAAHWPWPGRPRPTARLAEGGLAYVGRVPEHGPDRRPVPGGFAVTGGMAVLTQAPADLADADAVAADPVEHLPNHPRLLLDHLVARDPAAIVLAHVAIAVRGSSQHVDRPSPGSVALAAAAALQDLRTLILRHHTLDLEEQVVLGRDADLAVEEDDLDAGAAQLIDEQHLVSVAACEAVGRVDVDAVERARGGEVAQAFERRPHQRGAAVAIVGEAVLGQEGQIVRRDPRLQCRELAGDSALVGPLLVGDASIDGTVQVLLHASLPSSV